MLRFPRSLKWLSLSLLLLAKIPAPGADSTPQITAVKGEVVLDDEMPVAAGEPVPLERVIASGPGSGATMRFPGGQSIVLDQNTSALLSMVPVSPGPAGAATPSILVRVRLLSGRVQAVAGEPAEAGPSIEVEFAGTPLRLQSGSCSVWADRDGARRAVVHAGKAEVEIKAANAKAAPGRVVSLARGQMAMRRGADPASLEVIDLQSGTLSTHREGTDERRKAASQLELKAARELADAKEIVF